MDESTVPGCGGVRSPARPLLFLLLVPVGAGGGAGEWFAAPQPRLGSAAGGANKGELIAPSDATRWAAAAGVGGGGACPA